MEWVKPNSRNVFEDNVLVHPKFGGSGYDFQSGLLLAN